MQIVKIPESNVLTVIIRDDAPMFYTQDPPLHRSVRILLTNEQMDQLALHVTHQTSGALHYETISQCFLETKP